MVLLDCSDLIIHLISWQEENPQTIPMSKKKPKKISFKDDEGYTSKKPHSQDYNTPNYSTPIKADYVM